MARAEHLLHIYSQLGEGDQEEVIAFANLKLERKTEKDELQTRLDQISPEDREQLLAVIDQFLTDHGLIRKK
jgi:hypothetical protein